MNKIVKTTLVSKLVVAKKPKVRRGDRWSVRSAGTVLKVINSLNYFYDLSNKDFFDGTPNGMEGVIYPSECLKMVHEVRTVTTTTKIAHPKFD